MINPLITPLNPRKIPEAIQLINLAFHRDKTVGLDSLTRLWGDFIAHSIAKFYAIEEDNRIIALGAIYPFQTTAWLGHVGVHPEKQHHGLGRHMMDHLVKVVQSLQISTILLDASNAGQLLYRKMGFREYFRSGLFDLEIKKIQYSPKIETLSQKIQVSAKIPSWVLKKDKIMSGGNRQLLLEYFTHHGQVLVGENENLGFVMDDKVGPIYATDWEHATAIVYKAIALGAQHITIPFFDPHSQEFIQGLGLDLNQGKYCIRMELGPHIQWDLSGYYAAYGFGTG